MSYPGSVSHISNFTLIGSLVHKLRHFLYLPNVHGPYLAWDWKPEVDCRVIRLPVSILTSYSDFSGSYGFLKVSLKILSDDVLRTLPLNWAVSYTTKISKSKIGVILRVFTPKWGVNINSCHSHPPKGTSLARTTSFEVLRVRIRSPVFAERLSKNPQKK